MATERVLIDGQAYSLQSSVIKIGGLPVISLESITMPMGKGAWTTGTGSTGEVTRIMLTKAAKEGGFSLHMEGFKRLTALSPNNQLSGLGIVDIQVTYLKGPILNTDTFKAVFDDPSITLSKEEMTNVDVVYKCIDIIPNSI
jgi:hypothetical protein